MEVIVAQRLNSSLVEDESRESSIFKRHIAGGSDNDCVKTAIDEGEIEVDINSVVTGGHVEIVQKGKQHIFMTGVESNSCG